jgi:phospholipase C
VAVEHVIVLCLENRSFDHMLGFLPHPDPTFKGLRGPGSFSNPTANGQLVEASPTAKPVLPFGPNHSHDAVMQQLAVRRGIPTNQGFVTSYELTASGRSPTSHGGLLGRLLGPLLSRRRPRSSDLGRGPLIMRCQDPDQVPVLSTLALQFAVCDQWFSSVPGETWPNRNFMHAATSDGETNIDIRPYYNPTIFELLEAHGHQWRIYHDDTPQAWAFPRLWDTADRHARWFCTDDFADHVTRGELAAYTFIEPNHRPPVHTLDRIAAVGGRPGASNSQHPENNLVANDAYDGWDEGVESDFRRGEQLIATIYQALLGNPELFARTVLLITYDEHGGFYDHAAPTAHVPAPAASAPFSALGRLRRWLWHTNSTAFDFRSLGVRVPAVVVSPLIEPGVVDHTLFEHASVPATLRALFTPDAKSLTRRDAAAGTFLHLCSRTAPRTDLPDLAAHLHPAPSMPDDHADRDAPSRGPNYYHEFLQQADFVRSHLTQVGEPETAELPPTTTVSDGHDVSHAFVAAATRHRQQ